MRILIYSYNYYPEPIGIAPLITQLAEGLVQRSHEVRVITGMPNYPQRRVYEEYRDKFFCEEIHNGVLIQRSYVWIRPKPGLITRVLLDGSFVLTSMIQALRSWTPDIVLLTVPPLPICIPAAVLGFVYSCPVVLSLQDILPEAAIQVGLLKNKLAIRVFEALERFAYYSADAISVITDGFTKNLLKKGVAHEKMTCIPNWVDVNEISPLPKENNLFRQTHGLEGKFVVMYSGNIALTQGLTTVIHSAQALNHISNLVFVIVGEKKAIAVLERACLKLGVTNVKLLQFQPRKGLPQMLAAADVGLIVQKANVVSFNMPSKTQVLLASGRAIIASVPTTGTAADAVRRSGGGIVVPPEDPQTLANAILDLYEDPRKTELLGRQGRRHALEQYSFEEAINRYERLFKDMVEQHTSIRKPAMPALDLISAIPGKSLKEVGSISSNKP